MQQPELLKQHRSFGGWTSYYQHHSEATQTPMRFGAFVPPQAALGPCPVVYYLAGLTCTEETFLSKAGAQKIAAEHGLILVAPDTSPRGAGVTGEEDSWDIGTGAGFYVNATQPAWSKHYRMYDYITDELPSVVKGLLPVRSDRQGIMGHSMGGHGALVLGLRHPHRFQSISAFAPICAPSQCPWGEKAFTAYLGSNREKWLDYDACHLVKTLGGSRQLLIDQGTDDEFLATQLHPHLLKEACATASYPLQLRMREKYDHSYYFIASFLHEHLAHHARLLRG